jgi:WD40 repeat protein
MSIDLHPSGQYLATGGYDEVPKIWDIENKRIKHKLTGHSGIIWSVRYGLKGQIVASGSADGTVKIWNAETGKDLCTFKQRHDDDAIHGAFGRRKKKFKAGMEMSLGEV